MKGKFLFSAFCFSGLMFILAAFVSAQIRLVPHRITLQDGKSFSLNLPENFDITPAAENLKRIRFFAKAPDGRIFATDMHDLSDNKIGAVYILDGWNADTGKFANVIPYMTNLRNPNSVAFYTDANGQDWIYLAETDKLTRRKFTKGETKPSDTHPQTLATFPDYGLSYKYGGWHLTRTIAFSPAGKLYVSVGSSCNACDEKEEVRASILEMNPDGSGQRTYAKGLRNAVDIKWIGRNFFATNQGSDHLGLEKPDETFYAVKDGADYGWASCYSSNGKIFFRYDSAEYFEKTDEPFEILRRSFRAVCVFPAHASALGFDYFDEADSDAAIKNSFLVALHGSTNKRIGHGYKIVVVRKGEPNQDLINGFLVGSTVLGRPCGILKLDANSFLFTDDYTGVIYYVRKKGTTTQIAADNQKTTGDVLEHQENAPANSAENISADESKSTTRSCLGIAVVIFGVCLRVLTGG